MRKFLLFTILVSILFCGHAQEHRKLDIDSMLVNIDKSTFTSGILYDRTLPWAHLNAFNENDNLAKARQFEQALVDLYRASNNKKFISLEDFRKEYTGRNNPDIVDVGILNAIFHQINYKEYNENEGGLKRVGNLFEKIENGKPAFIENHIFMVSPLKEYLLGRDITYHFESSFLQQNAEGKEIRRLTANFDTSSTYTLIENGLLRRDNVSITYIEEGYKLLTFEATFSDGTSKKTNAEVHVKFKTLPSGGGIINVEGFTSDYAFQGVFGQLDFRIFYHNNQKKITKPIIIIDGFDPGDKRKIQDSDSSLPPDKHDSIEEFMKYSTNNGSTKFLMDDLHSAGYDVIIVNHPTYMRGNTEIDGGADYIERNALTHVTLYEALNDSLAQNNSTEQLVIVGPSMGGQISRYALAYMEKNNIPHNTRLWVSVDSPHLGANIPIGLQSLVNQAAATGNSEAQDFVNKQLGSTAAKQQLIEQFNGWSGNQLKQDYFNARTLSQGYSESRGRPSFQGYYNNLFYNGVYGSRGYPQNLRKLAIVNGSLSGNDIYNINPQTQDDYVDDSEIGVNVRGFLPFCSPWPFCWDIHVASAEAYALPSYGGNAKVSRFKKAFDDDSKYATNINSRGNMDNVPGGWYPGFDQFAGSIDTDPFLNDGTFWFMGGLLTILAVFDEDNIDLDIYTNKYVHSFIPTASSLGFINPDFNWAQAFKRNLVCTGEIPFDTYFGPRNNEQHTSFTEKSVTWLLEELAGNPQPPTVHLDPEDLSGPTVICGTDTATYSFDFCESLPVKTWEVSNNLIKTTPLTDYDRSIIVQPVHASTNGWAYVKAIFDSPNEPVQKNIWIGPPKVDFVEDMNITQINHTMPIVPQGSCDEFGLKVNISPSFNNVQEMEWEKVSTNYVWSQDPPGYNDPYVIIAPLCEDPVQFKVRMRNQCGWSDWQQIEDANTECQTNCGGGGGGSGTITSDYFIIYPVPADTVLHVNMIGTDPTDLLIAGDTLVIELFDGTGNQVKYLNAIACNNTIDVSTLNPGMYILKITYNNVPETHHISIN